MIPLIELADLVSERLATLGLKAAAKLRPRFDLGDFASLQARVVAQGDEAEAETRGEVLADFRVQVGIAKYADPGITDTLDEAQIEGLLQRVQDTKAGLWAQRRFGNYVLVKVENDPAYDPVAMEQQRLFVSLIVLTFRGQAC